MSGYQSNLAKQDGYIRNFEPKWKPCQKMCRSRQTAGRACEHRSPMPLFYDCKKNAHSANFFFGQPEMTACEFTSFGKFEEILLIWSSWSWYSVFGVESGIFFATKLATISSYVRWCKGKLQILFLAF